PSAFSLLSVRNCCHTPRSSSAPVTSGAIAGSGLRPSLGTSRDPPREPCSSRPPPAPRSARPPRTRPSARRRSGPFDLWSTVQLPLSGATTPCRDQTFVGGSRGQGLALTQESPRRLVGGSPGMVVRLRPTLPHRLRCSTIGAERLSFRVRNGTGRFPFAVTAVTLWKYDLQLTVSRELHSGREHSCSFNASALVWCQVIGLLVPVSYMHCCTSTSGLSTQWSTGSLSGQSPMETSS